MPMFVISGPPCSGKSTFVRANKADGDIFIDFDTLAQAIGSPNPHDHPTHVRNVTIAMRRAAIHAAIKAHEDGVTVWIVETNIHPSRLDLYRRVGANIRVMEFDRGVLHARAAKERPKLWHRLIDEWAPPPGLTEMVPAMADTADAASSSRAW